MPLSSCMEMIPVRSELELVRFRAGLAEKLSEEAPQFRYYAACYEACIPRLFWDTTSADVQHNKAPFRDYVLKYCSKMKVSLRKGYSLLFCGDNGAGKTMFISFVLTQAIRRGRSAYYTTLVQLDIDIKRGFNDKESAARLEFLLTADFVAIDELGKEHYKADSFMTTRLEAFLKQRYDDGDPVLLGTNLAFEPLVQMYGATIESMLEGRYSKVALEAGDFRKTAASKMKADLGFKS